MVFFISSALIIHIFYAVDVLLGLQKTKISIYTFDFSIAYLHRDATVLGCLAQPWVLPPKSNWTLPGGYTEMSSIFADQ
jgi:hypothetical protein